jgi:parallel beta-helix repeat protein
LIKLALTGGKNLARKYLCLFILIIFLPSTISQSIQSNEKTISDNTTKVIFVDDDNINGPWNGTEEYPYKTINDGIFNATEEDIIYVFNGTYFENLTIEKRLYLVGELNNKTIIDGNYQNHVINIIEDGVHIFNFEIRNSGGYKENAGIKMESNNNFIFNCKFYRTKSGILVKNSSYNHIGDCIFHTNADGIFIESGNNCKIENCAFYHNGISLNIQNSLDINITNCYEHTSGYGYFINNSENINIDSCAIYDNNDNGGGLLITFCKNICINNSNIVHNGHGLNIYESSNIKILHSDFIWNTHLAIRIGEKTSKLLIENCNITDGFRFGITTEKCRFKLKKNNIHSNLFGISIKKSLCNAIRNWWGSSLGPAVLHRRVKDRVYFNLGVILFFPWRIRENKNAGSDWKIDYDKYENEIDLYRFKQIDLPGNDTDNDLVPDWWEEKWGYNPLIWDDHKNIDTDLDGLNNIEECYTDNLNSSPEIRDIFIEYDWMESSSPNISANRPTLELSNQLIEVFAEHNINLHLDRGNLGGGEMVPYISEFSMSDLRDMYWDYFLENDLNNPRKGIFHWCFISDYGPHPGMPGFAVVGWDHLDSFEISAKRLDEEHITKSRGYVIASITMHELGHNLGLFVDDYLGIDNDVAFLPFALEILRIKNYKSCMNYLYTYWILDYSDGSNGRNDFDDWGNLDLTFFKNTHFEWPKPSLLSI